MHKSIRQLCRCSEGGKNELRYRIQQQNRQHRTAGTDPAGATAAGRLLLFGTPDAAALAADTLYVGFWTDKGKADADTLDFLQQLHGKRVFLFGTAGFGGSAPYFEKILAATRKALDGSNTVIGSFMCQGKMPVSVRQRYEAMKAKPLHIPNLDALIENFDKALSHPDAADLEQLKQAVK